MTRWMDAFEPVVDAARASARPLEDRPQQAALGQAVLDAIATKKNLLGEAKTGTGKSYAYLVPGILATRQGLRVVVSTETTALQDQLVDKDLPFLHKIYGDFKFRCLKGRSWYLCINRAKVSVLGNRHLHSLVEQLERAPRSLLGDGERRDVQRYLNREVDKDTWALISGESAFCADAGCKPDKCWSSRAREMALDAHVVVVNHALLRTDADMQLMSDGEVSLLGKIDVLVVDEAHTLDRVLVDGWTQEVKPWDVWEAESEIDDALGTISMHVEVGNMAYRIDQAFEALTAFMESSTTFLSRMAAANGMHPDQWKRQNYALCEYVISGNPSGDLIRAMMDYELENPKRLDGVMHVLREAQRMIEHGLADMAEVNAKGLRKVRKGARRCRELIDTLELIRESITTRNGIVVKNGVPFGVIAEGITMKKRGDSVIIKVVPLDVSYRAERTLWRGRTSILVSATLADPTKAGDMTYVQASLGVPEADEVLVDSPFAFQDQQLVYVTPAQSPPVSVAGARYSIDELLEVIEASNGRTLALFTARAELDHAADEIRYLQSIGKFNYPLLVQDSSSDKQRLVTQFREDEHSVLLATKSFFTGVDFPGSTCSTVAICKFPLPQYNSLCKQQIEWWRRRGFPAWYEREALLVFAQAVGRLIRAESDRGVVALLDQRLANPRERVFATAEIGIRETGSRTTQSIEDVRSFLS